MGAGVVGAVAGGGRCGRGGWGAAVGARGVGRMARAQYSLPSSGGGVGWWRSVAGIRQKSKERMT